TKLILCSKQKMTKSPTPPPLPRIQILMVAALFLGYFLLFWARKALTFVIPFVLSAGDMSQSELGLLLSWQQAGYTVSKFIAGLVVDRVSPKALLSGAFGLSGIVGLTLAATESLALRCVLMIASGIVIGVAWPSTVKIAKAWVAPFAFGTAWAVLSTAMNACGIVGAPLSVQLSIDYSWRASVQLPSVCCLAFCLPFVLLIASEPSVVQLSSQTKPEQPDDGKSKPKSSWLTDWLQLLTDPVCLSCSLGYMSVNACRYSVDWLPVFLSESRNLTPTDGAAFTSCLQAGGIVGSLTAGLLADAAFAAASSSSASSSPRRWQFNQPRLLVICCFNLLCVAFLHTIVSLSNPDWPVVAYQALGFCLGVCLFGPVAVYGVIATESAPTRLAFTSHAFCALFANVGAMVSGYPLGLAASKFGWPASVVALEFWVLVTTVGHAIVLQRISLSAKEKQLKAD
ncbi:hypothetical protein BOX15_Mlig024647g1, partial [Macrostomum lignano]